MLFDLKRFPVVFVLLFLLAGCGEATPAAPTGAPTDAAPAAAPSTPIPSPTPAATAKPDGGQLTVPLSQSPLIDGIIAQGEWDAAAEVPLPDGSRLFFLFADGSLFLGIQANTDDMIVGNIFLDLGDEAAILHASAALGTAIYTKETDAWRMTKDFDWRCRERTNSPGAQAARQAFFEEEGWMANNSRVGTPNELEYRIAMPDETLRLAVTFFGASDSTRERIFWPDGLVDDTLYIPQGSYPEELHFSPETWATLTVADRGEAGAAEQQTDAGPTAPLGDLGEVWTRPRDGMQMAYVPGGTFRMGASESDPDAGAAELPAHTVTLDDGFWIDMTEVTNAHYALCADAGACDESRYAGDPAYNGAVFPVVGVAWQDASDYCTWVGGRLPTEAEWEYAARGDGDIYPWGDAFGDGRLNFCDVKCSESWADLTADDGYAENAPAGSYADGASWVGALDMAGNVWEWVWDWYSDYGPEPQTNPRGPESGFYKLIRGGCWASPAEGVRTTYRIEGGGDIRPMTRHPNIGFRCVVEPGGDI